MTLKLFLTGATGYIGGEVLHQLFESHIDLQITCSVRSSEKAKDLVNKIDGKVHPVIFDLDNVDEITKQVEANDIIINTANVDHVPSAQAIAKALINLTTEKILIHTSGTSILGDGLGLNKAPPTIYYDDESIDDINNLPHEQPHRPVDEIIMDIHDHNPKVNTVIVSPSCIYGVSDGYGRVISQQIPYMIVLSIKNNSALVTYDGQYIWNHIHIKDLGELYILLLQKLVNKQDIPVNKEGYYFGSYRIPDENVLPDEPSNIEHTWLQVAEQVGRDLYSKRLVDTPSVQHCDPQEIIKLKDNDAFAPYMWGTNSRSRGNNGYKIGWKPKFEGLDNFWNSISDDIDVIIKEDMHKKPLPKLG